MKSSLSKSAKDEALIKGFDSDCCSLAFLSAVIHTAGSLLIGGHGKLGVIIKSANPLLKKAADKPLEKLYGTTSILRDGELTLCGEVIMNILLDCGILRQADGIEIMPGIDSYIVERECCVAAYVRGAFAGSGSLSATKSGYHLEFSLSGKKMADDLMALLSGFGIAAKYIERKDKHIVYLKENESILGCLALISAPKTALVIGDMFVNRQVRQRLNRNINCEMANQDRVAGAAVRQKEMFLKIVDMLTDEKLRITAKMRIDNPDDSYEQLAKMLNISKSGLKHRLKKLEELALSNNEEEK